MADEKFVKTKYGTRINVTGLDEKQQGKVLSMAQDKGAYGGKGAALAKTYQKNLGKAHIPGGEKPIPGAFDPRPMDPSLTQAPVDPNAVRTTIDPKTGQVKDPNQLLSESMGISDAGLQDARDAAYGYISKDYATQKQQEIEAAKQELANRGIPLDGDPNSLYSKTLSNIDTKYQGLDDQAKNQGIMAGNDTLGARTNASSAFVNSALGIGGLNTGVYNAITGRKGMENEYKLGQSTLALQRAKMARSGGGGAPADQGPIIGGMAPGFNVSNG